MSSRDSWFAYRNVFTLKRLGYSMDEIRLMPMSRFVILSDILSEEISDNEPKVREATQADIDAFLA